MTIDPAFRCSVASRDDDEPLAGTAPTESAYLLVEDPGPWGAHAVADGAFPDEVKSHLAADPRVRVMLIRRHGRHQLPAGRRTVYAARLDGSAPWVGRGSVGAPGELLDLDLSSLADGSDLGLETWGEPLWLVCTNGRRDRCCAEFGRPIAAALQAEWPAETWETTHLGGHRFAGTLLALPSGITLGRLDAGTAVRAVRDVANGGHPVDTSRGRAGFPPAAQVAELALRRQGATEVHWAPPVLVRDDGLVETTFALPDGERTLVVEPRRGPARPQSCGSAKTKPTTRWAVVGG